jgi:hypothetical protein
MSNLQICYICRFPTTDWEEVKSEKVVCSDCLFGEVGYPLESWLPSPEEQIAVYQMLEREWNAEDLEDFYQEFHNR